MVGRLVKRGNLAVPKPSYASDGGESEDVSGKILVILVIIMVLVSVLGTWSILTALKVINMQTRATQITPAVTSTQGQVIVTVLPSDNSKKDSGGGELKSG